ncbi:TetR/AcrR family transcriptional regulator [Vibrio furnissii]|uniref:TetR/AcrR family transcriptional regulator n=1 Tax=Vibrio furnissii TaxID=29494 RepID=UPI0012AE84CC|nr:TetR/AcrR family transcriptional regulator [Vibrio furnissii]
MKKTRSALKREAILSAAMAAFREFGAQSTSMDKIAAMAQVSKRTVYNHFASKEMLVMTLLADLWKATANLMDPDQLASLPLNEQLEQLLLSEIEILASSEYLDLARVVLGHYLYRPEELTQHSEQMAMKETQLARWLTHQGDAKRLTIEDIELANIQLHSLIKGSCFWPQILGLKPSLTEAQRRKLAQQSAQFFLSYYGVKK